MGIKYLEKDFFTQIEIKDIDNIIILGGAERVDNTLLSNKTNLNEGSERLVAGAKLSLENPNAKIYFLGGDGSLSKENLDETYVAKLFFSDIGFNVNKIEFIDNSRNTIENFNVLKKFNISKKTNILITSAFHMKRSLMVSNNLKFELIPYAVDFRSSSMTNLLNKYQSFDLVANLTYFNIFCRELIGILAFKLFY